MNYRLLFCVIVIIIIIIIIIIIVIIVIVVIDIVVDVSGSCCSYDIFWTDGLFYEFHHLQRS
jgi:hypothetical protein